MKKKTVKIHGTEIINVYVRLECTLIFDNKNVCDEKARQLFSQNFARHRNTRHHNHWPERCLDAS